MVWSRLGGHAIASGPWRIARCDVGGALRYVLTRDGDERVWCGVRTLRARYFDSSEAAKAAAATEQTEGAGDGADR